MAYQLPSFVELPQTEHLQRTSFSPSSFILDSSDTDILAAVQCALPDPCTNSILHHRITAHEIMTFYWVLDCLPPSIEDLFIFFCLRLDIFRYFCMCPYRGATQGIHLLDCTVHLLCTHFCVRPYSSNH